MKVIKNNYLENYSPELLSKVADTMPLSDNNNLLNLLIETVATITLNTIEFGRLSITALQYLLSYTHGEKRLQNMKFFSIVQLWQQNKFQMMHMKLLWNDCNKWRIQIQFK